ncbi:MAG: mRNA surveillance protein pelota [Candidatus Woesearchaeota archaeon]
MLILKKDLKHNKVDIKINSQDDLWYLSHLISSTDEITMKTERKIKINSSDDRNPNIVRKIIILTLNVEEVNYNPSLHQLRIKGTVLQGPEDVPKGSYHTFSLELNSNFTLVKQSWPKYLQDKLDEASKISNYSILIIVFDRETALFSIVKQSGIEHLAELKADVAKKDMNSNIGTPIYDLIIEKLIEYNKSYSPSNFICASPAFWKNYLEEKIPQNLKSKCIFTNCSEVHKRIVNELLIRPELKNILQSQRTSKEMNLVSKILENLQKENIVYGFEDVKQAANSGSISEVAITDNFIQKYKEENKYQEVDDILKSIDSSNGLVHFISSNDTIRTIDGLGGIVGILRWKLN